MIRLCPFCNNEITHQSHIKVCAKKHGIFKSFPELKLMMLLHNVSIDKDVFCAQYNDGYSIPALSKMYNLYYKDIELLLTAFNVKKRCHKEAWTPKVNDTYKKTCTERYGVDNVSKSNVIKEKKKQTFIKNYGVDNIFKSKEFIKWLDEYMLEKFGKKRITNGQKISDAQRAFTKDKWDARLLKIQNTCISNFGYDNYSKVPEQRNNISKKAKERWANYTDDQRSKILAKWRCGVWVSKLEIRIQNILNELQIEYTTQKFFKKHSYDFFIKNLNLFIEVQGDFWHANPKIYKESDELPFPKGNVYAKDLWKYDKIKKDNVNAAGYDLIAIWETEMKCSDEELVELLISKIKSLNS